MDDDREAATAFHAVVCALASAAATWMALEARGRFVCAHTCERAVRVPAHREDAGSEEAVTVKDGDTVAITGILDVHPSRKPLQSMNKDAAVFIESCVHVRFTNLLAGGPPVSDLRARTLQATDAIITARTPGVEGMPMFVVDAYGDVSPACCASVSKHDIVAAARTPASRAEHLYTCLPGGARLMPTNSPWWLTLLHLAIGRVDEEIIETDTILPAGVTATLLGTAVVNDGMLSLRPHPTVGLYFLLREGLGGLIARKTSSGKWIAAGAGIAAGIAAWQAWRAVRASNPNVPSLRRGLRQLLHQIGLADAPLPEHAEARNRRPSTVGNIPTSPSLTANASSGSVSPPANVVDPSDVLAVSRELECVACQERQQVACLVPCGHVCLCMTCARRLRHAGAAHERRCPMCRREIQHVVRVYGGIGPNTSPSPALDSPSP